MGSHRTLNGLSLFSITVFAFLALGCGKGGDRPAASISSDGQAADASAANGGTPAVTEPVQVLASDTSPKTPAAQRTRSPVAPEVLLKTTQGDIRIRLNVEKAPVTVDNFLANYLERGFYNQTVFHYVDKGFMIAAGGYTADLQAKHPRAYIKNEADNGLKNVRGAVAMARMPDHADSANSQFFINLVDNPDLDFKDRESASGCGYCVFGEVIEGLEVVDRIAEVAVSDQDQFPKTPKTPVVIESASRVR